MKQILKYLDDPPERKKKIILLTHGSLSRSLTDGWVKLAIIQRALYRRRNLLTLKKALKKVMGSLLYMWWPEKIDPEQKLNPFFPGFETVSGKNPITFD